MDEAEQLRQLKAAHNTLSQRATAVLALAEVIQDYRVLAAQLLANNERLLHALNNAQMARMPVPGGPAQPE